MTLNRLFTTAAVVAALAVPATGAFAQSTTPAPAAPHPAAPPAAAAPHAAAPATAVTAASAVRHMRDDQMRASKLIGSAVYDTGDQKLGSIADLIVDRDGKVADVVISTGSKHVGVPIADLKHGKDNRLVLSTSKEALGKMGNFDLNYDGARSGSSSRK
jgi:sporulation protein YlmC with PRC-barrel domain